MAYWHTGAPHRGSELGWVGRTADVLAPERVPNLLINVASNQSLAVKSARHTPVVFDEPERFARHQWMHAPTDPALNPLKTESAAGNRAFLQDVYRSANTSARDIQAAWQAQTTQADYGIAPMGLPKVAACIKAGLGAQLYYVAFANNAFDTHVQQAALHRRLLSYLCDGVYGFLADLRSAGVSKNVVVLMFSEFSRRAGENANQGTDHGTANVMFMAGDGVRGGHYGSAPDLTQLTELGNVTHTTDFRQVYATALNGWLGVDAAAVDSRCAKPGYVGVSGCRGEYEECPQRKLCARDHGTVFHGHRSLHRARCAGSSSRVHRLERQQSAVCG